MHFSQDAYQKLSAFLADYYDAPLYTRDGLKHPVVFYPAAKPQQDNVDSVLGTPPLRALTRADFYAYDETHLDSLRNKNVHLFNGPTFAMQRIRTRPLKIDGVLGKYFDMLATCYALEAEFLDTIDSRLGQLPMRSRLHREISPTECCTVGTGRSATIGGAGLVVFNDGEQYRAILSQRTRSHATRPDSYHLLPAFVFQPDLNDQRDSVWSIEHQFYREWLEELFGMAESGAGNFYEHPALVDLQEMQSSQQAGLYLSGIAFNLLTLRPEICMVLVIHDAGWWRRVNAPDSRYRIVTPEARGQIICAPITTDERLINALPGKNITRFVPQAIPALWEGVDIARERIGLRNNETGSRDEKLN